MDASKTKTCAIPRPTHWLIEERSFHPFCVAVANCMIALRTSPVRRISFRKNAWFAYSKYATTRREENRSSHFWKLSQQHY